jgi:hypothetical protein
MKRRNQYGPSPTEFLALRTQRTTKCWNWIGPVNRYGYPQMHGAGEKMAHRVAWVLAHGQTPGGPHDAILPLRAQTRRA